MRNKPVSNDRFIYLVSVLSNKNEITKRKFLCWPLICTFVLMDIHIHIANLHIHGLSSADKDTIQNIFNNTKTLIMTNQEAIDKLNAQATQLSKVRTEVQKLVDAAQNQGNVSPELEAAINGVQAAIQGVDDLNPDEVVNPEGPTV